eukprot:8585727-Heterocapsa_arctica.AAC.1
MGSLTSASTTNRLSDLLLRAPRRCPTNVHGQVVERTGHDQWQTSTMSYKAWRCCEVRQEALLEE